jgi:hypothetical protein
MPDFDSEEAEREWGFTLTIRQRMELLNLMNQARYGKVAMSRGMDRNRFEVLSMEEFNAIKEAEYLEDQAWLAEAKRRFFSSV